MKHCAFIIAGPTASGKSDFAHKLACAIGGTIINCDSVQIYRGIESISASPFLPGAISDEIDGIPYRLFSILDLSEHISVAEYQHMARREYDAAIAAGRTPIFVGGTGYYIAALINGISPMPDISDETRTRARQMVASDIDAARQMLGKTAPNDPQRLSRALEIFLQTGHHISEFQSAPRTGGFLQNAKKILISPPADILRARIAARIPNMISDGAIAQAQNIIDNNLDPSRAIGAVQLCEYLGGKKTREECIENWITKTNQYAKRQRTWFRTQFNPDIIINRVATDADITDIIGK